MTPRRRRSSALSLSLSSLAVGALAVTGLVVGPASAAMAADGAISGRVTVPAVAGSHRFVVQAWDVAGDPRDADLVASTERTLGAGATWDYSLTGLENGSYVVRVVEEPTGSGVPTVGDQFWLRTDWVGDSTKVAVTGGPVTAVDFAPEAWSFSSARISGSDRYGTSVASTQSVDPGVPVLYIASGGGWADALSAAPAAAVQGGALLLTDPDQLFPVTSAEITRLAPKKVVVVGSELTVSAAVFQQIDAVAGTVVRIGGTDRYDTSRKIVADAFPAGSAEDVFLATGGNFPDALSVGPVAGRLGEPVLLVDGANAALDAATRAAVSRLDPTTAVVLGQEPSISAGIQAELTSAGLVDRTTRIGGESRYATSRLINEAYAPAELTDTTYLASGEGFADALSGAAIAAAAGSPISLSRPTCVPAETVDSLKRLHLDYAVVLGSELTLSAEVGRVAAC
ncbi:MULTISPECIES: cell wall-binding repeat-containing protein [unclassified Rathayibacter]|uniref:cell wall-binding repeat-containing protein n=1 Tax=unclassified Rathayibacter TaxID=2609250 RepID=UPI000F4BC0B1|nr:MULTISPECIES: cell wall-binding repeat-containing protein [unclassified Rathayibacter]ROP49062.1 putative cell wall-binding protein [Rathayibacter sp. PhB186]ROS50821.1 putative cell wall-binding protein [Rathayibacter sp. PhB185]